MGKFCTITLICFCFCLISFVSCYKIYRNNRMDRSSYYGNPRSLPHNAKRQSFYQRSLVESFNHRPQRRNGNPRSHPHNNRRQSLYQRPEVENFDHRLQRQNSNFLREMEDERSTKGEIRVSGILVEDIDEGELPEYNKVQKRQYPDYGFDQERQQLIVDLHNLYRSNVTPPAANMVHMVSWNTKTIES